MATVIAYVDGFNLYHGLHDKYRRRYLWLDLEHLVLRLRPNDHRRGHSTRPWPMTSQATKVTKHERHHRPARPGQPKRMLMVASNPAVSGQTSWPIGFWWAELTHPYWEFTEHGYQVHIATPDGARMSRRRGRRILATRPGPA